MASEQQTSNTPEEERDLWRTPLWLFRFLANRYVGFDVDLAADHDNAMCLAYLTRESDALSQEWNAFGRAGFCNPPYSDPLPWVRRAIEFAGDHDFSTTLVLPTHRNEKWAALSIFATERIEFEGRVAFDRPDGTPGNSPRGGTQIFHFRAGDLGHTRLTWVSTTQLKKRWA